MRLQHNSSIHQNYPKAPYKFTTHEFIVSMLRVSLIGVLGQGFRTRIGQRKIQEQYRELMATSPLHLGFQVMSVFTSASQPYSSFQLFSVCSDIKPETRQD
jgi:hypothetical protein